MSLAKASLVLYLVTIPLTTYFQVKEIESQGLAFVHSYASLAPVASLTKLLELEFAETVVASACMSAVVEALVEGSDEAAHALFDGALYVVVTAFGTKLPRWGRVGGALASIGEMITASTLFGAPSNALISFAGVVTAGVGEVALFVSVLQLMLSRSSSSPA